MYCKVSPGDQQEEVDQQQPYVLGIQLILPAPSFSSSYLSCHKNLNFPLVLKKTVVVERDLYPQFNMLYYFL